MSTDVSIVIVAGGSGIRMGGGVVAKQFMMLSARRSVLMLTIEACHNALPGAELVVVLSESGRLFWESQCAEFDFAVEHKVAIGGKNRFESVRSGLQMASGSLIAIHDGVRPMVPEALFRQLVNHASQNGSAVPATELTDTLRLHSSNEVIDRTLFFQVQTPQIFERELIIKAYNQPYNPLLTDDASFVEAMGDRVEYIKGNRNNIKITTPEDLDLCRQMVCKAISIESKKNV